MRIEPQTKRVFAFFDGQNLFYAAKEAFGYTHPNYNPQLLAKAVCNIKPNWKLDGVYFYTGVPDKKDNAEWNFFWSAKLGTMGHQGIKTFSRPLRYRNQTMRLPDGKKVTYPVGQEKGIDIRIALDVVRLARENVYDVAVIFSQDQDLSEAVDEVRYISQKENRWIKVACAFPISPTMHNERGINGTDWIEIDRSTYDRCLDPNEYRLKGNK